MSLSWFLQLMSLYVVLSADICDGAGTAPPCYDNWFGSPCRYQCHCASGGTCNKTTGECTEPTTCEKGWFGTSCQYVDLVTTNTTSTPDWVYDSPDMLCNPGQDTVTITLTDEFYFTWLRLWTSVPVNSQDFRLQLMSPDGGSVECSNQPISIISATTVDIYCQEGVFFQQLTITGDGVRYLCSVQISGGRNVALGQKTIQSSSFKFDTDVHDSWLAVDGKMFPGFGFKDCASTDVGDISPSWTLIFDRSHHINRYVLNIIDLIKEGTNGFILQAYQENTSVAFNFTDLLSTTQEVYRIQSTTPQIPVLSVTISNTTGRRRHNPLLLCEVKMFGDTVCPVGQYGRDCEKRCNCAKNGENCFVSTGGCPSGCAAGYQGEECQNHCDPGFWGYNCSKPCRPACKNQLCNAISGACISCFAGKSGENCNQDCDPTFWGDKCAEFCSSNCKDQLCSATSGTCFSCVAGKSGQNCTEACEATYYGENCALTCSSNCADQLCDATNAHCHSCVPGKFGVFCDKGCPSTTFGKDCNETCSTNCTIQLCDAVTGKCASCIRGLVGDYCDQILSDISPDDTPLPISVILGLVIGFLVLVTVIVSGALIFRLCRRNNDVPEQTTRHTSQNTTEGVSARTVESDAETAMSQRNVTRQTRAQETWESNNMQGNRNIHNPQDGLTFHNAASTVNETPIRNRALFNPTTESRGNFFQEQLNAVPFNNTTAEAAAYRSEDQNSGRRTFDNDYEAYCILLEQPEYEDGVILASYIDDTTANPYAIILDSAVNPYEEINDV